MQSSSPNFRCPSHTAKDLPFAESTEIKTTVLYFHQSDLFQAPTQCWDDLDSKTANEY